MTGPLQQVLYDWEFRRIAHEEARRTVIVPAADVDRATRLVEEADAADLITVRASDIMPGGMWWVVDEQAMEADLAESLQRMGRHLL